jgi:ribose transport system permease protein
VWGTILSILLLATGVKGFQLASGEDWVTSVFDGLALILAVGTSVIVERRRTRSP